MTDVKLLAEQIVKEIRENQHAFWLDPEKHSNQHEFIQLLINEREEKRVRRERVKEKIAGSLILSFIIGLVGLIGSGFLDWLKVHLK